MRFVDRVERFFQIITDRRRFFIILAVVMAVCYAYVGLTALWEDVYHYWFNIDYFHTNPQNEYIKHLFITSNSSDTGCNHFFYQTNRYLSRKRWSIGQNTDYCADSRDCCHCCDTRIHNAHR